MAENKWVGMHNGHIKSESLRESRKARKSHAQRKAEIASKAGGKK